MKILTLDELKSLAENANGSIDKIYLHWTAGHYGQAFDDYHINIDNDGTICCSTDDLTELKSHTWHRNTGAIGISMMCCVGAIANDGYDADFGECPPTSEQIEMSAKVIAVLCQALGLDINSDIVMTHEEAATKDGYGPGSGDPETRWDLWYLFDSADNQMKPGGDVVRGKAVWYQNN